MSEKSLFEESLRGGPRKVKPSVLVRSFISRREGSKEPLFSFSKYGAQVNLDGYIIIPIEKLYDQAFTDKMKVILGMASWLERLRHWYRCLPTIYQYSKGPSFDEIIKRMDRKYPKSCGRES